MDIRCPYCTQLAFVDGDGIVAEHKDEYSDDYLRPFPTICPMSGEILKLTDQIVPCIECEQRTRVFENSKGKLVPEGHNYSWHDGENGKRFKGAPVAESEGNFFSRPRCNNHCGLDDIKPKKTTPVQIDLVLELVQ